MDHLSIYISGKKFSIGYRYIADNGNGTCGAGHWRRSKDQRLSIFPPYINGVQSLLRIGKRCQWRNQIESAGFIGDIIAKNDLYHFKNVFRILFSIAYAEKCLSLIHI